jgi:N utilization substance protein B
MSNRHIARGTAMQILYQWDFKGQPSGIVNAIIENTMGQAENNLEDNREYIEFTVLGVLDNLPKIDELIKKYATNWPIETITIIDKNILRVGIFEMMFSEGKVPAKVAINEAIEIAKNFNGPSSGKFVNGILGAIYNDISK